jgi:hypothetical protein
MKLIQRAAAVGALATTLVGGTALIAPQAGAAAQTTTAVSGTGAAAATQAKYNNACGAGYKVVNSAEVGRVGTVFLTYSSRTGDNCVVTVRAKSGTPIWMVASIRPSSTSVGVNDSGRFRAYAGPVFLHAAGKCVSWYGVIGNAHGGKERTNCGKLAGVDQR